MFQPAEGFSDRLQLKLQLIVVPFFLHQVLQFLLILGQHLIFLPYDVLVFADLYLKLLLLIDGGLYLILC